MITIKKVKKNTLYDREIYLNGTILSAEAFYDSDEKQTVTENFPDLDIQKIAKMKAQDFPDNFLLSWSQKPELNPIFDLFQLVRKGDKIKVVLNGGLDLNNGPIDWLFWNPDKLAKEICRIANKKGYKAKGDNPELYLTIKFVYKAKGLIGPMVEKALLKSAKIQLEAEHNMLKLANKKFKV